MPTTEILSPFKFVDNYHVGLNPCHFWRGFFCLPTDKEKEKRNEILTERDGMAKFERQGYSIPEAAQIIGCSPNTLRKAVKAGTFPSRRIYGKIIIPKWAVDQFLGGPYEQITGRDWDAELLEASNG